MGWFIAYLVPVVVYFYTTYHALSPDAYHSTLNAVIGYTSPIILFIILGIIGSVLERKGIIKPPSKQEKFETELEEAKQLEKHCKEEIEQLEELREEAIAVAPDLPPSKPRQPTIDEMLHTVDLLDGPGFERWCAQLLRKIGFLDVTVTKVSGDQGVDITAVKDDVRYAIQCKCYSSDLGNHPVQEVHAGKSMYGCHVGVVMTNRYFTSGAKDLAKATGTLLWDRNKLKAMLQQVKSEIDKRAE